jgi:hypothetical protein
MNPAVATDTTDVDALLEWIDAKWVTFALSFQKRKTLEVAVAGGYRVTVCDDVVYEGTDGKTAVKIYNDA